MVDTNNLLQQQTTEEIANEGKLLMGQNKKPLFRVELTFDSLTSFLFPKKKNIRSCLGMVKSKTSTAYDLVQAQSGKWCNAVNLFKQLSH